MEEGLNLIGRRGEFFAKRKSLAHKFRLVTIGAMALLVLLSAGAYGRVKIIKDSLEAVESEINQEELQLNKLKPVEQKLILIKEGYKRIEKVINSNDEFIQRMDYLTELSSGEGLKLSSQILNENDSWSIGLVMLDKQVFDDLDQKLKDDLENGKIVGYELTKIGVDNEGYHYSVLIKFKLDKKTGGQNEN